MEKRSFYVKFIIKIPSASLFKNNRLLCAVCARFYTCVCARTHRRHHDNQPNKYIKVYYYDT